MSKIERPLQCHLEYKNKYRTCQSDPLSAGNAKVPAMAGRFTNRLSWRQMHDIYGVTEPADEAERPASALKPRFNIAPMQMVPVVRAGADGGRELTLLRWGLVPSWTNDSTIGARLINARAETVAEKPAFRAAFKRRRCLVPADGFYEWRAAAPGAGARSGRQPYFVGMSDGAPFAMAGLWERWEKGDPLAGEPPVIESFTIITCGADPPRAETRPPVILDPADWEAWMTSPDTAIPLALLQPYPEERMTAYPVSRRVSSPGNDDEACVAAEGSDLP